MDTTQLTQHAHRHEGGRRSERAFPVMLVISFLVLSACAAFAVIMTNGPDGRANAEPVPAPTLSGAGGLAVGTGADKTTEPLSFGLAMPEGPVVIGQPGKLVITITNPHAHDVALDAVTVTVRPPTVPGCAPEWLHVDSFGPDDKPITIRAGGSARVTLPYELVDLGDINQDACKGVDFPLTITGSGRPV